MSYTLISEFVEGREVDQVFYVSEVEMRQTKKGALYTQLKLRDRGGLITCRIWDFNGQDIPKDTFWQISAKVESYNGSINLSTRAAPTRAEEPDDLSVYTNSKGLSNKQIEFYLNELMKRLNSVECKFIKTYLQTIFSVPELLEKYKMAPASVTNRGAYKGGLVEHLYKVGLNADQIVSSQRQAVYTHPIKMDYIHAGVLIHDVGKALSYEIGQLGDARATRKGKLLEHLPLSFSLSIQAFIAAESVLGEKIPSEIQDHINHIILSHHGALEYGSPVKPKTIEAMIVHIADMADSMTSNLHELVYDQEHLADEKGMIPGGFPMGKDLFII
jgi:3'-5' exoribonuclease